MNIREVKISEIKTGSRMRQDPGDLQELASSIGRLGLLQPIVLDQENNLIAGGRRLAACHLLGWNTVPCVTQEEVDEAKRKELELEENVKRKDLTWQEEVSGLEQLYELKRDIYGKRTGARGTRLEALGQDRGFGVEDAAKLLERSVGSVGMDLQLARALREYPELTAEKSKVAAFKRYRRMKETQINAELAKRRSVEDVTAPRANEPTEAPIKPGDPGTVRQQIRKAAWRGKGILYHADSRDVLRNLQDNSIDLIVTDPPYGLGLFKAGQATTGARLAEHAGTMYDDDPQKVMDMLDEIFRHCSRVLRPDGHAYIFFHMTRYEPIYLMLRSHFGTPDKPAIDPVPIIWIKNTPGIGDPNLSWTYAYEPCFWINRGRSLVKPQAFNYLKFDTVQKGKIHPTEKPVQLLRHLVEASSLPGEVVLDPFAGSGSTLIAATQLDRRFYGVEQHEPFHRAAAEKIAEAIAEQPQAASDDSAA